MDDFPPFKNYVVTVLKDGSYMIFCTMNSDMAFMHEEAVLHSPDAESVYMFGAEDLVTIIKMYGHHIGEVDV